jgi:hypothetical protein
MIVNQKAKKYLKTDYISYCVLRIASEIRLIIIIMWHNELYPRRLLSTALVGTMHRAPTLLFCLLFGNNHNITKTPCRVKGQEVRSSCGTTQFLSLPHDNELNE